MVKKIPFEFVIEELASVQPVIRPMFGCFAVYVGEKIVLMLRDRKDFPQDNGVWVATTPAHQEDLKKEFPSLQSIALFGDMETQWQVIPRTSDDFEESVMKACGFVRKRDPRIGKIPKAKQKKSKQKK